jgi:threonine dehydratase
VSITTNDLRQAHALIRDGIHETAVMQSASLNQMTGASLFFKCEHLQKTGSFKARGALNAVRRLDAQQASKGVATHSSGNHGAALARAAALQGIVAYIVVPTNAPAVKKANIALHGAQIIECESNLAAREAALAEVVERTGASYIPPYDDARVIAGQGTAALELIDAVAGLDAMVVPVGGGGLLAGSLIASAGQMQIFGAEPEMADDAYRSFTTGVRVTSHTPKTMADGLQTTLGEQNFVIIREQCQGILLVSEAEIGAAMQLVWSRLKQLIEPSSAVTLAAVLRYPEHFQQKRVGLILTGGNVSVTDFSPRP